MRRPPESIVWTLHQSQFENLRALLEAFWELRLGLLKAAIEGARRVHD